MSVGAGSQVQDPQGQKSLEKGKKGTNHITLLLLSS